MSPPTVEMISDGDDLFVVVNGVKVAKRGRPGTAQANTWVSLGPGWTVLDRPGWAACGWAFEKERGHWLGASARGDASESRLAVQTYSYASANRRGGRVT
jgi:hypothetical protein